jgi:hypothetical protein
MKNNLFENMMNMISSLSFYAPLIICVSVITFSILSGTMEKALVFFVWIFVITFIRVIVLKGLYLNKDVEIRLPDKCLIGLTDMFIPQDVTYSTYILTFTMMYLITPMVMISRQSNINGIN